MATHEHPALIPSPATCHRAVDERDAAFDGRFYVAIVTTRIYCRPVCPSRRANPDNRRFFARREDARQAGFRACLRCRPDHVGPSRASDPLTQLAHTAAKRIAAGALNGRSVASLAGEFDVSERHLRRALRREFGRSPVEIAQAHRLLRAKQLLTGTALPVTQVAFASGFQSLRRFNALVLERYRVTPTELRGARAARG